MEYRGFQDLVERGTVGGKSNQAARPVGQPAAMPPIVYVDGFAVPNYENRNAGAEVSAAVQPRRLDEVHPGAG